jgi:hypothetical protein
VLEASQLGINEINTLVGSIADPIEFAHLNEVRDLNTLFGRASDTTSESYRLLESLGIEGASGKKMKIERIAYSEIHKFKVDAGTGLEGARDSLEKLQGDIYIDVRNKSGVKERVTVKEARRRMAIDSTAVDSLSHLDPEEVSTFGYMSSRDGNATVFRYNYVDDDGKLVYLSQRQIEELRIKLGGGLFNPKALLKNLSKGYDPDNIAAYNPGGSMGSFLQKMDKRLTASTSDRKIAQTEVESLIQEVNERLQKANPILYERMQKGGVLPKNLEDVFLSAQESRIRMLDAIVVGDKTALEDIAQKAADDLAVFERSMDLSDPTQKSRYGELVKAHRKADFELAKAAQFGQKEEQLSRGIIRGNLKYYGIEEDQIDNIFNLLSQHYEDVGSNFSLKSLNQFMVNAADSGNLDPNIQKIFQAMTDNFEKAYDGSGVLADFVVRNKVQVGNNLIAEIDSFNVQYSGLISSGETEQAQRLLASTFGDDVTLEDLARSKSSLKKQIDLVSKNGNPIQFDDVTARILLGEGQAKTVLDIRSSIDDITGSYGAIGYGSEELFKLETSFGRFTLPGEDFVRGQAITLDPISGHGFEKVYADVQANIFHSPYMQSDTMLDMMARNKEAWSKEIDEMLTTGVVPQSLMKKISQQAAMDVGMWEESGFTNRAQAMRFRDDALELMQMLRSGAKPSEIPDIANKLIATSARDAMRQTTKGDMTIFQPTMPGAQRQAVDTEGTVAFRNPVAREKAADDATELYGSRFNDPKRLADENMYKDVEVMIGGDQKRNMRLLRFRSDGHKLIVPDIAAMGNVGTLYSAGGGFDLDDKFITDLSYMTDSSGNRRLATFAFRQPTGPQEFAVLMPQLDEKTLTRMMGSDDTAGKNFRAGLQDFGRDISSKYELRMTDFNQGNYLELLKDSGMSNDERVIKYLEALSMGNNKMARAYYGGGNTGMMALTEEEIERGFFNLADREAGVALEGSLSSYTRAEGAKRLTFNRLSDDVLSKTALINEAKQIYGSTSLQLSAEEIMANPDLAPSYRNQLMLNIHEASITMKSDDEFVKRMQRVYNANSGFFNSLNEEQLPEQVRDSLRLFSSSTIDGAVTNVDNQAAFLTARTILAEGGDDLKDSILLQFAELKNRALQQGIKEATPGALGGYINTLGVVSSSDNQFADIISKVKNLPNGDEIIKFLSQNYLGYVPEGAVDFAVGGGGVQKLTQLSDDLVKQARSFMDPSVVNSLAPIDIEESVYKALYQLTRSYQVGVGVKQAAIDERFVSFEDFSDALSQKGTTAYDEAVALIQAELNIVRENLLVQQGAKMGRVRALYHAGLLGEDEMMRLGLDEFTVSMKMASSADKKALMMGVMEGVSEAANQFELLGKGEYNDFASFIGSSVESFSDTTATGRSAEAARQASFNQFLNNSRFGFGLSGEALDYYRLDAVQRLGKEFQQEIFEKQSQVTRSKSHIDLFRQYNKDTLLDEVAQDTFRGARNAIEVESARALENYSKYDEAIRSIDDILNSGRKVNNVVQLMQDKALPEIASVLQANTIPTQDMQLLFSQDMLYAYRQEAMNEASQSMYDSVMASISRPDKPADLERTMRNFYLQIQDMKADQSLEVRRKGIFMENLLVQNDSFFEREGIERLDAAYRQARSNLLTSTFDQRVIIAEERMRGFLDIINPIGDEVSEDIYDLSTRLRSSLRTNAIASLEIPGEYLDEAERLNTIARTTWTSSDLSTERVLPEFTVRGKDGSFGGLSGRTVRESLMELYEAQGITQEDAQMVEDFIQLQVTGDKEITKDLIRSRMMQGYDSPTPAATAAVEDYLLSLDSIASRNAAQREVADEIAQALFDRYQAPLDTVPRSGLDILDEVFDRTARASDLADDAAAGADDAVARVNAVGDIPYTRITDKIRQKFPAIGEMFTGMANHKGATLLAAAGLASGAALYASVKKGDHSSEAVAGPPLLPGGSPYEMPPSETVQYPDFSSTNNMSDLGDSYELRVSGSQEQMQSLIARASEMSNSVSANLSNTIPDAGRNPYADIAGSF